MNLKRSAPPTSNLIREQSRKASKFDKFYGIII